MKQSDPVYDLAENIVNSMNRISQANVQKAGYDKTYKTIILGINRIFVDAIPAEKQNEIITNNAIPEDASELDYTFYTICLSGTYYVIKSVGEFKLYEEVILRVPNGDWSNMFLEVAKGGCGNVQIPKVFKSPTAPSPSQYQINIGDYWIQMSSGLSKYLIAFYEYTESGWEIVCNDSRDLVVNIDYALIIQGDDVV